jgi:hypothetical protein
MNEKQRHPENFAEPDDPATYSDRPTKPVSLRDRWEEVRYGPLGRVLGYILVFTLVFVSIFLFLFFLERGHF